MANPFYIEPTNPLQALMLGVQGFDRSRKLGKEQGTSAARLAAQDAIIGGGDTKTALARLLGVGDTAGATVLGALGKADSTDEIKEYNLSKSQGFKGSFTDWKTGLKLAGATKINNSVNTGENEYSKILNKGEAERFLGFQKEGQNATNQLTSLDIMEKATKDPNFYSGAGAERFALPIKQATAAFGGDPSAAASMETFRAHSNKSVLDSMGGSLGTGFSNADRDFVIGQVPNLQNTPEGNRQLIDISRKVTKRKQEIAKLARDYAAKNGGRIDAGFDGALAEWANKNPLFKQAEGPAKTGTGVRWRVVE